MKQNSGSAGEGHGWTTGRVSRRDGLEENSIQNTSSAETEIAGASDRLFALFAKPTLSFGESLHFVVIDFDLMGFCQPVAQTGDEQSE